MRTRSPRRTPPEAGDDAARPLAGVAARARGNSLALRVAASRLRALGCAVETESAPPPPGAPAGWLGVTRVPFGTLGGAHPECGVGWAGPVDVPMATERAVQAVCGIAQVHGRAVGGPRTLGVDYASVCAGVLAAQAVTAGVLARLRGAAVLAASTSVAQAALLALTQYVAVATAERGGVQVRPEPTHRRYAPPFRSADGVRFEVETLDAEAWLRFWTGLGADRAAIAAGWPPFQRRFATATCPLPAALFEAAAASDYPRVEAAAERGGVSVLAVRAAAAPLPAAPASPWRLRGLPPAPDRAGAGGAPVSELPPLGPQDREPLAGVRVVEVTSRVQGPLAGHLLGLLGADVVRLEPPGGDPLRGVPPTAGEHSARFLALNRGKRAVEVDLKSAAGQHTARRMAASAHVFLHNWPPNRAARTGLDHGDLAALCPSLVYAHAGGWADTFPDDPQPLGTDYLVQAHSGVAALVSAPGEEPAPSLLTLTDVLGALISAEGVVAALLARARTGTGVRVETALIDAARLLRDTASGPARAADSDAGTTSAPGLAAVFGTDGARLVRDTESVPDAGTTTDLAVMAADPRFAAAFDTDGAAAYSRAPWTFAPAAAPSPQEATR